MALAGGTADDRDGATTDPHRIVTVVDLDDTGLRLTQTDSYVVGQERYRTDVRLDNTASSATTAIVYRAGGCFLQDSDVGYGEVDPRHRRGRVHELARARRADRAVAADHAGPTACRAPQPGDFTTRR